MNISLTFSVGDKYLPRRESGVPISKSDQMVFYNGSTDSYHLPTFYMINKSMVDINGRPVGVCDCILSDYIIITGGKYQDGDRSTVTTIRYNPTDRVFHIPGTVITMDNVYVQYDDGTSVSLASFMEYDDQQSMLSLEITNILRDVSDQLTKLREQSIHLLSTNQLDGMPSQFTLNTIDGQLTMYPLSTPFADLTHSPINCKSFHVTSFTLDYPKEVVSSAINILYASHVIVDLFNDDLWHLLFM